MTPNELKARTKKFAVDVILFAKAIPQDPINCEMAVQLTDAATSTAAHYRAVCRAKSRADFINKLSGAIEEVDESALWLEILSEAGICASSKTSPLWKEADELTRTSCVPAKQPGPSKKLRSSRLRIAGNQRSKSTIINESLIKDPQIKDSLIRNPAKR